MAVANAGGGWGEGQRRGEQGGLGWLKERQNSNYFITPRHYRNNIRVVQCAARLSVEQMSSPPGKQTATLSLR